MQRWKNIAFNTALVLNCLLIFFLIVESRLSLPAWLQVVGRMHPLVLHFPVVLVILYAISTVFLPVNKNNPDAHSVLISDWLLLLAALSAALTALAGLFLSREEGYDPETLLWHKWSGVAVSVFAWVWYYFREQLRLKKLAGVFVSLFAICLVVFAGHQGAGITHGQNFLLAPMMPEKQKRVVTFEEALVYADMIQPILESKCMSCHNSQKAKGELVMETEELLLRGGKSGILWDSAAPDLGLFLQRVHLPLEQKKHMPPQGKPQLTEGEIFLITQWIKKGADFKLRLAALPETDTLRKLAQLSFSASETAAYDFEAADQELVKGLNTVNRIVTEEALNSPALTVSFFNSQLFKAEQLKELSKIKTQIVSLDLAKMPVTDEDLKFISELENLRRLNLSFTSITGATLGELKKLKFLHSLSVSGTKLGMEQLNQLPAFTQLKTVYVWNLPIAQAELDKLQAQSKALRFETGFRGDTTKLKLSAPVLQNEETIVTAAVPLKLRHYINGVSIRYTLDGTEPDSIHSPEFKGTETINGNMLVKARAYKPGWISSDLLEASFYKSTYRPDTVIFITQPDPGYKPNSKLLVDLVKGETNFRNGNWLAWRQSKMEVLLHLSQPETVQSITLGSLIDIGSYIMPPASITIWGGDDPANLSLLTTLVPKQPQKMEGNGLRGYECNFKATRLSYIKVIATPVAKLPAWHPGKGDKAWVFADEILIN